MAEELIGLQFSKYSLAEQERNDQISVGPLVVDVVLVGTTL